MQKKLLGVAVAAALAAPGLALAQSSVQVYGTVHLSINQTKFGNGTAATDVGTTKYGVNSHASNWGLRSTESLGGGMTAWFQAEFNMQMERRVDRMDITTSTPRNSGVGLRGGFGNVYLGTWETPWAQTFRFWDVGSIGGWGPVTSIMGRREQTGLAPSRNCTNTAGGTIPTASATTGLVTATGLPNCSAAVSSVASNPLGYPLWRRFQSSIFYESPVWSGVQFKLAIQPNETKATNTTAATAVSPATVQENPSAWSGSLAWTGMGGRARVFLANMRAKDWSTVGQTDSGWTFGGGYDFGAANVGAAYERYSYQLAAGEVLAKQWGVGIGVPVGPGKIGASYAKALQLSGAGAPAANDTQAKMWNIGYEWTLSKRTNLGFGVAKIDNGANQAFTWTGQTAGTNGGIEAVTAGQSQSNIFVSIRHSF